MRGRKPVPSALKLVRGNPGHRTIPPDAPVPAGEMTRPSWLKGEARREWNRVAPMLAAIARPVDRAVLVAYCQQWALYHELDAEAKQHPHVVKAPSGYPIPNPARGMANVALKLMLAAAVELGITPSARSRVKGHDAETHDPLERFLAQA